LVPLLPTWAILHQIEIALETMAQFQHVLEGEFYVTASLVPIAVYQIRKNYQEVLNNAHSIDGVKALRNIILLILTSVTTLLKELASVAIPVLLRLDLIIDT
jgi:hypothetical protein